MSWIHTSWCGGVFLCCNLSFGDEATKQLRISFSAKFRHNGNENKKFYHVTVKSQLSSGSHFTLDFFIINKM